jgi:hypothetical protein
MPSHFELVTTLSAGVFVIATIMALYPAADRSVIYHDIVSRSRSMPFTLSCAPDGSVLPGQGTNCLEARGYRFVRDGLDTVIAKIAEDGTASVIFRGATPHYAGYQGGLWLASKALRKS